LLELFNGKIFFILTFISYVSCSTEKLSCPEGTYLKGETCIPFEDEYETKEILVPDAKNDLDKDNPADDADMKDGVKDSETVQNSVIGKACNTDSNCKEGQISGVCLDWNKGYCTVLSCPPCPEDAVCLNITKLATACLKKCGNDGDCRTGDSYACKKLMNAEGESDDVCYQIETGASPLGGTCNGHEYCEGGLSCLTSILGGYCAAVLCSAENPCSEGSHCVYFNGVPTCMKSCGLDDDCKVEGDYKRACLEKKEVMSGGAVKVCLSGKTGVDVGGQCLNDNECSTSKCNIVYKGICSFSKAKCLKTADCKDGGICEEKAEYYAGFCTQDCQVSKLCPGSSLCVGLTFESGYCSTACFGVNDSVCRPDVGMKCLYGDPIGAPDKYACAVMSAGDIGADCKADPDCKNLYCLDSGGSGYCTMNCSQDYPCPFPTQCIKGDDEAYKCYKRCKSTGDCPSGFQCKKTNYSSSMTICVP